MQQNAFQIAAALSEAKDVVDLHHRVAKAVRAIGCEHFLLGLEVKLTAGPTLVHVDSGYPEHWQRRYAEQNYIRVDPTIGYCQTQQVPVVWSPTLYSEATMQLMEESASYGLGHGLSVPVHQGSGIKSMFSMARDKPLSDPREASMLLAAGHVLANMAHVSMQKFVVPSLLDQVRPSLTDRELVCLRYTAEGKGSQVIADLLKITKDGVDYHLNKVMRKLGVATRIQAVALAVQLRMIP
jgi:DNA-binding CsgD family transcriptional regulator